MKGWLRVLFLPMLVVVCAVGLGMQQPPDESNLPDYEKQIPQGHFCMRTEVYQQNRRNSDRAHACDCVMSCVTDDEGNVTEHEDVKCKAFCHANGRACTCHTEEPCPAGHALMNMDGQVVAVPR